MTGFARSTVSASSSIMMRSTPWVDGCCGPMLRIIVSSTSGHGPPVNTSSRALASGESGASSCAPSSVWCSKFLVALAASRDTRLAEARRSCELARFARSPRRMGLIGGLDRL